MNTSDVLSRVWAGKSSQALYGLDKAPEVERWSRYYGGTQRTCSGAAEGVDCYGEECLKCSHLGGKCKILIDSAELRTFFAKISGKPGKTLKKSRGNRDRFLLAVDYLDFIFLRLQQIYSKILDCLSRLRTSLHFIKYDYRLPVIKNLRIDLLQAKEDKVQIINS